MKVAPLIDKSKQVIQYNSLSLDREVVRVFYSTDYGQYSVNQISLPYVALSRNRLLPKALACEPY